MAEIDFQKALINPATPDGVYRAVLARTEDEDKAQRIKTERATQDKLDMLRMEGV